MELSGVYLATHFENAYQTWAIDKVLAYVRELRDMGCNSLGFWFDQHEYRSTDLKTEGTLAHARWRRLCQISQVAHEMGMKIILCVMANEAYLDQVTGDIKADTTGRSGRSCYPTQLCVSKNEAAEICTGNITELADSLPFMDYLMTWPYDQGGCDCLRCDPWARTYVRMSKKIYEAVKTRKPSVELMLSVWCMDENEVQNFLGETEKVFPEGPLVLFNQDSRNTHHGLDAARIKSLPYGEKVRLVGFPEISMLFDDEGIVGAMWGILGANPLPRYLSQRFYEQREYLHGMVAYSEGIYEDVNKWVLLSLGRNSQRSLDSILEEYGKRFLSPGIPSVFPQFLYRLEENWRHRNSWAEAREILSLAERIQGISPEVRDNWRWRILFLRAQFDELLPRGREQGRSSVLDELQRRVSELKSLYRCADFMHPEISVAEIERCGFLKP